MNQTEPITGAEFLARSLAANGTSHVFFIDAVLRRTLIELGTLGVRAYLAIAKSRRLHGRRILADRRPPGVCFAQSVGAANLASGLQDAYLANTPVIAITGHKQPSMQHRNAYQELPHSPMFSPVTKFSALVDQAADLPRLMRQALREAMTGTPRPAHLDLNGLQAEVIETGIVARNPRRPTPPSNSPSRPIVRSPPHSEIDGPPNASYARQKDRHRRRYGATASRPARNCWPWPRLLQAPVATSLGGRGLIPTRHRLSVGCAGNYAAPPTNQIVHAAELVLFVGCHTGDQVTHTWRIPAIDTPCVQIDLDPRKSAAPTPTQPASWAIQKRRSQNCRCDRHRPTRDTAFGDWAAGVMAAWRQERAPMLANGSVPIWPDRLCDEITRALPHDGILVADTGYSSIWSSSLIELNGGARPICAPPARSAGRSPRRSVPNARHRTAR